MFIYNLYPTLAGYFSDWRSHLLRVATMGFEWVYINPIHVPGESGSLYSIADYFTINPLLLNPDDLRSGNEQFREISDFAKKNGLRMMADLVVNHCATDSPLVTKHPEWIQLDDAGKVIHPHVYDNGEKIVWTDLAQFSHTSSAYEAGLYTFITEVAEYLLSLGFAGFRCDMAFRIPGSFWQRLIKEIKQKYPDCIFLAETLGCPITDMQQTARSGFDYIYNNAKWWDFEGAWFLQQHDMLHSLTGSVAFPENHDTGRLYKKAETAVNAVRQRSMFTAFCSSGWLITIGFEFGFTKNLCVANTRPADWENPNIDIQEFIAKILKMKKRFPVLNTEGPLRVLPCSNRNILVLWKATFDASEEALLVLNKDLRSAQRFSADSLGEYMLFSTELEEVSPEFSFGVVPLKNFSCELGPGRSLVFIGKNREKSN